MKEFNKAQMKTEFDDVSYTEEPLPDYDINEEILEDDHIDGLGLIKHSSSSR